MRDTEKLVAQGLTKRTHLYLDSGCAQKGAGNAYPPKLIAAVVHPHTERVSSFDLANWPPQAAVSSESFALETVPRAMAPFGKPCKNVKKLKKKKKGLGSICPSQARKAR